MALYSTTEVRSLQSASLGFTLLLIATMLGPELGSGEDSIFFIASAANLVASDPMSKATPPPAT